MNLTDLKGKLLVRHANLQNSLAERKRDVVLIEADLIRARKDADATLGALKATEEDLADIEAVIAALEKQGGEKQ